VKTDRGWKDGFTLIELLIVIAIVLILIAIALPNFLEAQIRARVVNAQAEMRGIEPAVASYLQDWKRYPADGFELPPYPGTYRRRESPNLGSADNSREILERDPC
jgi:prepilin-type N-terminal cleavage/methylation domain-containing protein